MSMPFARSTRSIPADNMRAIQIGIGGTVILMLGWAAWFFLAKIPRYETSEAARFARDGVIVADFSPQALGRINVGQSAFFEFTNAPEESQIISTMVVSVDRRTGRVKLAPAGALNKLYGLQEDTPGTVNVIVEQISPAGLVMRVVGLEQAS